MTVTHLRPNMDNWQERVDLAAAFRWTARLNYHEAVANHFSLAVNEDGTRFLMNPNQSHFSRIKASDIIEIDANNPDTLSGPDAPDPTAWGLHGSLHRNCPHARCAMHVHSIHATVLASLKDSRLLPIDQNCATFYNRYVIDDNYGGLAFEDEGERCAAMLQDPKKKVMIMGNHGVLVIGERSLTPSIGSIILNVPRKLTFGLCKPDNRCACFRMKLHQRWLISLKPIRNRTSATLKSSKQSLTKRAAIIASDS